MIAVIGIIIFVWYTLKQDRNKERRLKDLEDKLK